MERRQKASWLYLAALLLATPAAAQNQAVCDDLRGQLANVTETVGINHKLRQYSSAMVEQTFEIRKITNDLQDNECSSGSMVVIKGDNNDVCAGIEASLKQAQEKLQALTEKRDEIRKSSGIGDNSRGELVTALHANGCDNNDANDSDTVISNRPEPQLYSEFGDTNANVGMTPLDQSGGPSANGIINDPIPNYSYGESSSGNVRTVCVRTCDGGFFPMTAGATAGDFQRDGETCAKMCPGVKTELFFHKQNQETSAMISAATGAPYSAMPYAFAFRKRPPNEKSSCTCNLPAYYEEMQRENALSQANGAPDSPQGSGSIITLAPKTPVPLAGPVKNAQQPAQPTERPYDPSQSKVRQVGPQFLSSDQSKIDLTHPAAPGAQPEQ